MKTDNLQINTWILPKPINKDKIDNCRINYILQRVLSRRGLQLEDELEEFLSPSSLPNPNHHFNQLSKATDRIIDACNNKEKIAICGDYDADGITSTVLLLELLSKLGAKAISYIPSRLSEGYGLNTKMVNELSLKDISLIITVDNGISAFDAIKRSKELNIDLIITDHHKIPKTNLDVFAIIHPERSPINSPYKSLAGVGIAYLLAKNICYKLNFDIDKTTANALFCIGTVADMAPLIGANRKWLKECLPKIHTTKNIAIRTIIKELKLDGTDINSEDIGYKIAPLINAVGRIDDPTLIINLLTSSSESVINELVKKCFTINTERKRMSAVIEKEANEIAKSELAKNRMFLVLTKKEWHIGIIGIVASRMVEKYNLPTAILSIANDGNFRGSIRSNNKLKANLALDECSEILIAKGGHSAAAGFTIKEENISKLREKLNNIAIRELKNYNLKRSIKPDAYISLNEINHQFYSQLMLLGPFGNTNPAPIFWTRKCRILEIYRLKGMHIKMTLNDETGFIQAVKWNTSKQLKVNDLIDIAFNIEVNKWKKENKLQLNIIDIKNYNSKIDLQLHNRTYKCELIKDMNILITNKNGQTIHSDLSKYSNKKNTKKYIFARKILSFAEIALGKAT